VHFREVEVFGIAPLAKIRDVTSRYWPLIKSLQTGLLLSTGLAGYSSARCPVLNASALLALAGSLFLAISGSTVLNMWYDRDIDARMRRTCWRPLPLGRISPAAALRFGLALSVLGVGWALALGRLYGGLVFCGWFCDVVVYTLWLKRRTGWSIVWGGISGAVPVLAGRAFALGAVDWIGLTLALGVLFWIPTHTLTYAVHFQADYAAAGVPTIPAAYGVPFTHRLIALSSVLAASAMIAAGLGIGMAWGYLRLMGVLSAGLLALAATSTLRPSARVNYGLFRYASLFMLGTMVMLVLQAL
jgi:protoheme IX farnesyltransferase